MVDGTGSPAASHRSVLVQDGRITAVGPSARLKAPPGATVIDGRGKTLLPGFVMVHEHMFYPSSVPGEFGEYPYSFARLYLAGGETTIRTAGTLAPYGDLNLARAIDAGEQLGPDMDVTGPYLAGPHPPSLKIVGEPPFHGDTTYFSVADRDGMMVSIIQSNYRGMGSGLMPDGLGFMFQDRGEMFSLQDGHPNIYAPAKRPFQTIIPGFATRNGEPWLAYGVMGGDMQPQGQVQIIANLVDYKLGLQEAGDAPRWHHEGSPEPTGQDGRGAGVLHLESGVPSATRAELAALGWQFGRSDGGFGGYEAVARWPGRWAAATEMRKDGVALGY